MVKCKVVMVLFLLLLFSSYQALQVQSAVITTTMVITIVGVGAVSFTLTASQLNNLISILASSRYAPFFPRPLTDPNAPALKRWEIEVRPYTTDDGKKMRDQIEKARDLYDFIERISNTLKTYIDEKKAGISRVENIYDNSGYYLFITETRDENGFRNTYLKWAKWPKETISVSLIGTRDIAAPSVRISSPNGGESWKAGEIKRITWSASDNSCVHYVDIFYSTDGGKNWITVATKVDNTGYYDWKIPLAHSTRCLVKIDVYDVAGNRASDTSDKPFTIWGVISPNGGENWSIGSVQTIRWSSTGINGNVRIDLSRDGGLTWTTIISSTPNDGSEPWTVTGPDTTRARIRVVSLANPAVWDASDRDFTIFRDTTPPIVKVISPNGGEVWKVSSIGNLWRTQTIRWSASDNIGVTRIDIFYSTDGGKTWRTIATGLTNTGSYTWRVPDTPSKNCLVRVDAYDAAGNRGSDTSDKPFTIER